MSDDDFWDYELEDDDDEDEYPTALIDSIPLTSMTSVASALRRLEHLVDEEPPYGKYATPLAVQGLRFRMTAPEYAGGPPVLDDVPLPIARTPAKKAPHAAKKKAPPKKKKPAAKKAAKKKK